MKIFLLLPLFFYNSLYSQHLINIQTDEGLIERIDSHHFDLRDESGNIVLNYSPENDSIVFNGNTSGMGYGYSVSSAGDVNGDGFDDIIIGAVYFNNWTGRAYIYYGGINLNNIADVTLSGEYANNFFGGSVSTAGDVNGDGFDDVIVSAYGFDIGRGKAYIYLGGMNMNSIVDVVLLGSLPRINFGTEVSSAGDVNGDGFDDVIVGTYDGFSYAGSAYIYYGGSSMNNFVDVVMTAQTNNTRFGIHVSSAGDVNGDGLSDVIIGAPYYMSSVGRAYIYFGGYSMNNVVDVTFTGQISNYFGSSVSSAGDVNGDGYSDVIIGGNYYSDIFYGGSFMNNVSDVMLEGYIVTNAFDINKDGYSDVAIGRNSYMGHIDIFYGGINMNVESDLILNGDTVNSRFGSSVASAGDVNGDGYYDLIVGAWGYDNERGRAYLYTNLKPKPELIYPENNSINIPNSINFQWEKLDMTEFYILNVSEDSTFNSLIINDTLINDTSKTINSLLKETKYYWRVEAIDSLGVIRKSRVWNFTTIPPIYLELKVIFEGMYFSIFNQMTRRDSITAYLYETTSPYNKIDSAISVIDSISFSGLFKFLNATTGTYYIVVNHFNTLETWSKSGGELLMNDGMVYNYNFTTSVSQAYGNNQKLKGSKFCIYSGDVNQDKFIDISDFSDIDNDSYNFVSGRFVDTDLNGDNFVDQSDMAIADNNRSFIGTIRP